MAGADPYLSFAARYDAFRTDAPERRAFFERLFDRYHVRRVLDCACGTGDDLLLFRSLGLAVVGSDLSDAMLALAETKLAAAEVEIPLVRADFRELPEQFADSFDAVVCLCRRRFRICSTGRRSFARLPACATCFAKTGFSFSIRG